MARHKAVSEARLLDAACRQDFPSFVHGCFRILNPNKPLLMNWHIYAIAARLELIERGVIKRLIITAPPRSLKSLITSVMWVAFLLGRDPGKRVIVASYSLDLAANLHNAFREIVTSDWYRHLFPLMRISAKNTELELGTDQHGYRLATSVEGSLTGRGGDILVIDDYLKPADAQSDLKRTAANGWFFNTALSRLDDKRTGAVVVVGQRLHGDDLPGVLMARSPDEWTVLSLPAIATRTENIWIGHDEHHRQPGDVLHAEREPLEELEKLRSQIGSDIFEGQWQQCPIPLGGFLIDRKYFRYCEHLPQRTSSSLILQSWDPASKPGDSNSRAACTTWLLQDNAYYFFGLLVGQFLAAELIEHAVEYARRYKPQQILVEELGTGLWLSGELKKAGFTPTNVRPEKDKFTRMWTQVPKFQRGQVFFLKQAPGLAEVESELLAFPHGRRDDIVDSFSQALAFEHSDYAITDAVNKNYGKLIAGLCFYRNF
jgi:predicted phage terminase large subunit-like protein